MPPGAPCEPPRERSTIPFLTMPTACNGALTSTLAGESWAGEPLAQEAGLPSMEDCDLLPFTPSLGVTPVQGATGEPTAGQPTTSASTPTALRVHLRLPQEPALLPEGLAESSILDTSVSLPDGLELNPSAANGLQACSERQIGFTGINPVSQTVEFTPAPAICPEASKLGTVRISTPDLSHALEGGVYLAAQDANPFASLFALYIAAEDPVSKVRVKLAGEITVDEETGEITTSFQNAPQVSVEDLEMELFGGPRASLATPPICGTYSTHSRFTPWSGGPPVEPEPSSFQLTAGPAGSPCSDPLPFQPSFLAGSTSLQAGGFTGFSLEIGRPDGQQPLSGVTVTLPSGVAALLSTVTPCRTPPAGQEWACGPESLIGSSLASSGLGPDPYQLPGQLFLTEGYGGAPFGIVDITPAVAGPFNLGNVVVRSKLLVNPTTAVVTVVTEPLPQHVRGIAVQLKQLNVTVNRPDFEFNPTSCERMTVTGSLSGLEGASVPVSSPFQVSGCAGLPFHPALEASTGGRSSRLDGDSFDVRITSAGLGQANIAKVDLQIPEALPSRQSTLEKACLAATFEADPASCPPLSVVGMAVVHTPVLRSPLAGPAYLVSHGGAAFPDLEFVLQGEGIELTLDGQTEIRKGITYSRFESAPDAPFTSFETSLPAGPDSILTGYDGASKEPLDLCGAKLAMPTTITAQNGDVIRQETKINVTGCAGVPAMKTKTLTRTQKLDDALAACRKKYKHHTKKRQECERQAHKRYPPPKSKKADGKRRKR